jgi:iron complex transport system ATP-binding protein
MLLGLLVGAALGVSGALFQSVLRNPLASPDVIGVSQGASVGAVLAITTLGLSGLPVALAALAGGLLVAALTTLLAWRGGLSGYRFVLCGIGLAFLASSLVGYGLTRSRSEDAQRALRWVVGSTSAAELRTIVPLAVVCLLLVPVAVALSRTLGLLEMGDLSAQGLGVSPLRTRVLALLVGVALASAAVAAAGPGRLRRARGRPDRPQARRRRPPRASAVRAGGDDGHGRRRPPRRGLEHAGRRARRGRHGAHRGAVPDLADGRTRQSKEQPMTTATARGPREGPPAAPPPRLRAEGLSLSYDRVTVVHDVDLEVPAGKVTVVVGANGSGKSTLVKGLARLLRPRTGRVLLGDDDLARISPRQVAAVLGLLPQAPVAPEGIVVADLVARGRYPHQGLFGRHNADDDRVVATALARTGTDDLAERRLEELSGGQRQRVWIAMVLAQQPRIMLLDEPTTFLDVAHQVDVLDLLDELNGREGTTVVMVLHDLNLAARYADHLVMMRAGRVVAEGAPRSVLTADAVRETFGLPCVVVDDPVTGDPMVVPLGTRRRS